MSPLDTLDFSKKAIEAGFTPEQAEFQAKFLSTFFITQEMLKDELDAFQMRLQITQVKIIGMVLTGATTIISVVQAVYHIFN